MGKNHGGEQPVVVQYTVKEDTTKKNEWREVIVQYDNDLKLTLIPHRDDSGRITGLEAFTLIRHTEKTDPKDKTKIIEVIHEDYVEYRSGGSFTKLMIAKRYLAELLDIALHDCLYWEYKKFSGFPKVVYAYHVAEATQELADELRQDALV